ncbi:MAG: hypothetical protein HKP48_09300 [Winogradskyella sp.]|uniref:hypothetical protein n=1 Tax=Winogradskyella sp. TaxID=1883156 RepID=UPI0017F0F540|nr:hypothetical protein [Winogradskyella sp.]MBT8244245.1 hypothetical protein [Winogradskyella sp.]NNK23466.1 hypothetical protein [Winogradskyella sp.]
MTTITKHVVALFLCLIVSNISAQETEKENKKDTIINTNELIKKKQIDELIAQKAKVEIQERNYLKADIKQINKQLEEGKITASEAEQLKKEAAKKRAANIEDKKSIIDKKIALYKRTPMAYQTSLPNEEGGRLIRIGGADEKTSDDFFYIGQQKYDKPQIIDKRTTSNLYYTLGFNNAIGDGQSLGDSPYSLGGSGFSELGYSWKTRLFKNTNFWRLNYGVSLQWNKLDFKNDNQYLVNTNSNIVLQNFNGDLKKAKFRTTNLVLPMHIEFGPSRKIVKGSNFKYSMRNKFKIGLGGYAGLNIGARQKLKYKENGSLVKEKQNGGFEMTPFVYGLSGYVGIGNVSLYAKYDLNPLFKDQAFEQNNISLGIRFDLD